MRWTPSKDRQVPSGEVLIYAEDCYYVAVLVEATADHRERTFVSADSSDLLPWPSHWMNLPPPPSKVRRRQSLASRE